MCENISKKVLEKIINLKNEKGLSDEELSKKTDIYLPYLRSLMNGNRNNPSLDTLNKLSEALGKEIVDFL